MSDFLKETIILQIIIYKCSLCNKSVVKHFVTLSQLMFGLKIKFFFLVFFLCVGWMEGGGCF